MPVHLDGLALENGRLRRTFARLGPVESPSLCQNRGWSPQKWAVSYCSPTLLVGEGAANSKFTFNTLFAPWGKWAGLPLVFGVQ